MSKVESLMGGGTLQTIKAGLFGSAKDFEVKYQFQLTIEEENKPGILQGFLRADEKYKLNPGTSYILLLDDKRKSKVLLGKPVATVKGVVTYGISGQTFD